MFAIDSLARAAQAIGFLLSPSWDVERLPFLADSGSGIVRLAGLVMLLWAMVTLAIARGLYLWRRWARLAAIAYYLVAFLGVGLVILRSGISVGLLAATLVAGLLLLGLVSSAARAAFGSTARGRA